jgi:hypothetical protein
MDGISFIDALNGSSKPVRSDVYISRIPLWERVNVVKEFLPITLKFYDLDSVHHYQDYSVRSNKWKLIHRAARSVIEKYSWYTFLTNTPIEIPEYELYNIQTDPLEQENVFSKYKDTKEIKLMLDEMSNFESESKKRLNLIKGPSSIQQYR